MAECRCGNCFSSCWASWPVLWEGDPLDVGHYAEQVWLGGRAMPMRSRQTELRDRYMTPASTEPRAYSR